MRSLASHGLACALLSLLLGACGAEIEDSCLGPTAPTWDNFGDGFVRNYCRGCHSPDLEANARNGAPVGVDFSTYADVLARLARVEARAANENPTMPPGGPSSEELHLLRHWIACGAP